MSIAHWGCLFESIVEFLSASSTFPAPYSAAAAAAALDVLLTLHLLAPALPCEVIAFKLRSILGEIGGSLSTSGFRPSVVVALLPLIARLAINVATFVGEHVVRTLSGAC
jgi:hypothetical protein